MTDLHGHAQRNGQDPRLDSRVRAAAVSAVWGTLSACEPPTLPADTAAKRLADRVLPRAGWANLYFVGVVGLWIWSAHLVGRPGLAMAAVASFAGGSWCAVNFWRCRHAHCVVTGAGWLVLAALAAVEALLGHSLINGFEGVAFVAVLGTGMLFEFGWYLAWGTSAVTTRHPNPRAAAEVPLSRQDDSSRS
ncbi:MAG: hypothetical protein ACRDRL_32640 [Sciscionella sp.]